MHSGEQTLPTRIAFVVDNREFGGYERAVLQLAGGLPRARFETAVVCTPGGELVEQLHDLGVPVLGLGPDEEGRIRAALNLARELRSYRPDVVHVHGAGALIGVLAAKLARVPVIASSGGVGSRYDAGWRIGPQQMLEQAARRVVDKFIVLNRSAGEELAKRYRVSPSKVVVIPNGVGLERYDPARPRNGAWRARLGIHDGAKIVGGIGRLVPEKGFRELVRAFAAESFRDVWLVIAGDGPDWEELHALVDVFDLRDRVLLPGFVDDVPGFLADLDVFVLPSLAEEHPVVLLEAMAMACPVVATEIAGVGDTIADGVDGMLVVAGDVPSLAVAIGALLRDPTAARRLGRNARRKIEQEYTVEKMLRRTAVLYEELLFGPR